MFMVILILSAIIAIHSEFVGFPLLVLNVYPNNESIVSGFPLAQALSIAFLIALSTFCDVVLNFLATLGYKVFVIEVKALAFKTVWIMASRRY
jgi:hypothetical protein